MPESELPLGDESEILTETLGATRVVRFNRPAKRNAFTAGMYDAVTAELRRADGDPGISAVVLTGRGDAFCAGNDLEDFLRDPPVSPESPVLEFIRTLVGVDVPLIAAVHGHAVGIGATMLLHCDFVVADETARLSFPFVPLGLVPEAASSLLLPRTVGPKLAASLLLTGDPIGAAASLEGGLLTSVVEPGHAFDAALAIARKLESLPGGAVRATRRLLHASEETTLERVDREAAVFAERLRSADFQARAAQALRRS